MKLGFMCGMSKNELYTIDDYIDQVKAAESMGFDQAWMGQVFSMDAISMMTLLGRETSTIRLGTAVTPSYPRHPTSLALQALTASAASKGRFDLGVGLSHKLVIEGLFGIPYAEPAKHMREYLEVLMPLLRNETCAYNGELFNVNVQMTVPEAPPVSVVVAALGPKMLENAGRLADGTCTWMTGPDTLKNFVIPTINKASKEAGKPKPRIVASLPVILTSDVDKAKEELAKHVDVYDMLPSYRGMLDRENAVTPVDIAMVGDETALREQLQHLKAIGVTDFNACCYAVRGFSVEETIAFLAEEKAVLAE
jgi:F420-dependent oxidoreductase-like protein